MNKSKEIAVHTAWGQAKEFTTTDSHGVRYCGWSFFFFLKSGHFCPVITFVVMQEKIRIIKSDGAGCKPIVGKEGISPQPPFFFGFSQCLRITLHN